jgi:hypothetical protein
MYVTQHFQGISKQAGSFGRISHLNRLTNAFLVIVVGVYDASILDIGLRRMSGFSDRWNKRMLQTNLYDS